MDSLEHELWVVVIPLALGIFSHTIESIVDSLFPSADFPLLDYINDDGLMVEPKWYCPILPMVLINGMVGIGTGFSTSIPQFNPLECSKNIKRKLNGMPYIAMKPYYRGQVRLKSW